MLVLCESRISQVTVHARGALVTRIVTMPADLPDGALTAEVGGVTILAEPGSMRATLAGGRRLVVGVRTAVHVPEAPAIPGASVERVRGLVGRIDRLRAEQQRLEAHRGQLLEGELALRLRSVTREGIAARAADALAVTALVDEALEHLDGRLLEIEAELDDREEELETARLADAQAQSRARAGAGHPSRRVAIEIAGDGPVEGAEITYAVPAARWWPTYALRLADGGVRASWSLEAFVAQRSGESWDGVRLSLSTADLVHDARLPELASRRLGRAQPRRRPAYRPPPAGLDDMFKGYDRVFARARRPLLEESPPPSTMMDAEPFGSDDEVTLPGYAATPSPMPVGGSPPPPRLMPAPQAARGAAASMVALPLQAAPSSAPLSPPPHQPPAPPPEIEPRETWLDHDGLHMAGPADERRGRLSAGGPGAAAGRALEAATQIESIAAPAGARDPLATRGRFDHRHDAAGAADVPSDGAAHRLTLAVAEAATEVRWRAVAREAAEVYREASLQSPFATPLLSGPVDVYLEGTLLATTAIDAIDRGGRLVVGMGVEDRVKIARNARTEESAAGLMRGSTVVETTVTIELSSSLPAPALVTVIDRLPVSDDKALTVELEDGEHGPERPERYDQSDRGAPVRGGLRWQVELPAGGKRQIAYRYTMSFSAKSELVGGNRRD